MKDTGGHPNIDSGTINTTINFAPENCLHDDPSLRTQHTINFSPPVDPQTSTNLAPVDFAQSPPSYP